MQGSRKTQIQWLSEKGFDLCNFQSSHKHDAPEELPPGIVQDGSYDSQVRVEFWSKGEVDCRNSGSEKDMVGACGFEPQTPPVSTPSLLKSHSAYSFLSP
jgi:hypothetical protein